MMIMIMMMMMNNKYKKNKKKQKKRGREIHIYIYICIYISIIRRYQVKKTPPQTRVNKFSTLHPPLENFDLQPLKKVHKVLVVLKASLAAALSNSYSCRVFAPL